MLSKMPIHVLAECILAKLTHLLCGLLIATKSCQLALVRSL